MEQPNTPEPVVAPITVDEASSPDTYEARIAAQEAHRLASRPNIDHLPDAVARDELGQWQLLARPGEKVIIERFYVNLAGAPWRDTKTFEVDHIDGATGKVTLHDPELLRQVMYNVGEAIGYGFRFKLPTARMPNLTGKRKRGRPRKNALAPTPSKAAIAPTGEAPAKRGRGRPKGSKNRPKDVVKAEKAAKKAKARTAKAKKRPAKKER